MNQSIFKKGVVLLLATLFLFAAMGSLLFWDKLRPGPLDHTQDITIAHGKSTVSIAKKLEQAGIVRSWVSFVFWSVIQGKRSLLQSGVYEFKPQESLETVLNKLATGDVKYYSITIPEGLTVKQILAKVTAEPNLSGDDFSFPHEGTLFPSTYYFSKGDSRKGVLNRMITKMNEVLKGVDGHGIPFPLRSIDEVLVLASLVEKETAREDERSRIASVYLNRLKRNMPLQCDPTLIYHIREGNDFKHDLKRRELKDDHPYNTYTQRGLPPTPICCPGKRSLESIFEAKSTDELYFVADGTGGHLFTSDYAQHLKNSAALRKKKASIAAWDLEEK